MSDRVRLKPASFGPFSTSLTSRYVERARREGAREQRQAIALVAGVQILLWIWAWYCADEPRMRAQLMILRSWPALLLLPLLWKTAPRAATIVAALAAWILCVVILGFAM